MNLYAVAVENLGTRIGHAVRADSPGAALQRLLDAGLRHFQRIDVYKLDEELLAVPPQPEPDEEPEVPTL